jgi:hypothetical protein
MVFGYIIYMDELKIRSLNIKLSQLCKQVKDNMCNSFLHFWNGERVDAQECIFKIVHVMM